MDFEEDLLKLDRNPQERVEILLNLMSKKLSLKTKKILVLKLSEYFINSSNTSRIFFLGLFEKLSCSDDLLIHSVLNSNDPTARALTIRFL